MKLSDGTECIILLLCYLEISPPTDTSLNDLVWWNVVVFIRQNGAMSGISPLCMIEHESA